MDPTFGYIVALIVVCMLTAAAAGSRLWIDLQRSEDQLQLAWRRRQAWYLLFVMLMVVSDVLLHQHIFNNSDANGLKIQKVLEVGVICTNVILLAPMVDSSGRKRVCFLATVGFSAAMMFHSIGAISMRRMARAVAELSILVARNGGEAWLVQDHREGSFSRFAVGETLAKAVACSAFASILGSKLGSNLVHWLPDESRLSVAVFMCTLAGFVVKFQWRENIIVEKPDVRSTAMLAIASLRGREATLSFLLIVQVLSGGVSLCLRSAYADLMQEAQVARGYETTSTAYLPTTALLANGSAALVYSFFATRIRAEATLRDALVGLIFASAMAALTSSLWMTYAAVVAAEIFLGLTYSALADLRASYLPAGVRGTLTICFNALERLSILVLLCTNTTGQALLQLSICMGSLAVILQQFCMWFRQAQHTKAFDTND
mmetsp:Transcript_6159/g.18606  ORF Transcript_6159/g.18606 Transcript_6159/m.18606 type:complete len:433 (-) Transcript_6159:981-2279(-)